MRFASKITTVEAHNNSDTIIVTYKLGTDNNYLSKPDRERAQIPILQTLTKRVNVDNVDTRTATNVTPLPIPRLSKEAAEAHTFEDFLVSLLSIVKASYDGSVSIFIKQGVTVHKEMDVLITMKGQPAMIDKRNEHGRYQIPLVQQRGQWQLYTPTKRAKKALGQTNSVYNLPSTEQAIKWMYAVYGHPVKSTWLKASKAGNFVGWPLLTVKNVAKYYPETVEMPKGHMNQTRKMSGLQSPTAALSRVDTRSSQRPPL